MELPEGWDKKGERIYKKVPDLYGHTLSGTMNICVEPKRGKYAAYASSGWEPMRYFDTQEEAVTYCIMRFGDG